MSLAPPSPTAPEFVGRPIVEPTRPAAPRGLWLLPLVLIVATEYKIRKRDIGEALSGAADFGILLELALFALVGVVAYVIAVRSTIRWVPLTVLVAGYCLTTAASALYAPFPQMAAARGVQLCIIGLTTVVLASVGTRDTMGRLVDAYVVLLTFSIALGVAWVAPVSRVQQGRFTWLYTHSVISGALLALSVVLLTARLLGAAPGQRADAFGALPGFLGRRTMFVLLAVHALFLLRTQTRASVAAAFVGCLVIVWLRVSPRFRPQLAATFLAIVAGLGLLAGGAVLAFVERGEDVSRIATFNRRTEIWTLAFESFLRRPFHGLGYTAASGVFYDATAANGEKPLGGAHNAFVEVITDVGLIGFAWWAGIITLTLVGAARLHRRHGPVVDVMAVSGVMTCLLINAMTIEGIGSGVSGPAIALAVCAAWIVVATREDRASGSSRSSRQGLAQSGGQSDVLGV